MKNSERDRRLPLTQCAAIFLLIFCRQAIPTVARATEQEASKSGGEVRRPLTVGDTISMNTLGLPSLEGTTFKETPAVFSPDGRMFIIVTSHGNLRQNTNDYSLILFHTKDMFLTPAPTKLLRFSSSSNRPAIQSVKWLDNRKIAFLGENPGEEQQLYTCDVVTKTVKKLTNHSTNLVAYDMTANGQSVFFMAEQPAKQFLNEKVRREGIRVSSQSLPDLIVGNNADEAVFEGQLFAMKLARGNVRHIEIPDHLDTYSYYCSLHMSPDGRYVVLKSVAKSLPEYWSEYRDAYVTNGIRERTGVARFTIVDNMTGKNSPLVDAPIIPWASEIAWSPDSKSVAVAGTFLPLDVSSSTEREERRTHTFVVQVYIPSKAIVPISGKDLMLLGWDSRHNKLIFDASGRANIGLGTAEGNIIIYERNGSEWKQVESRLPGRSSVSRQKVILKEDLNTPPKLIAIDQATGKQALLLDMNPQFDKLNLGTVKEIMWNARDGHEVRGGLYLPPDYVLGKRYPLVIQTHGWDRAKFWIDGPMNTAYAAQPLANKEFVVVQVGIGGGTDAEQDEKAMGTAHEAPREMSAYEGMIDYLDSLALIDRTRVGIVGFSRTCFHVKYTLTHSNYEIGAAVAADGFDAGYFQYMALANARPWVASDSEGVNGSSPFGKGLTSWLQSSPGFRLEEVHAPILIEALGRESVMAEWEWFSGLSRLGKTAEMLYLPEGAHELVKPSEKMASQQGTVDWFCFWLKGEEDPDPAKVEQYARWRDLRKLQDKNKAAGDKSLAPMN